MNSKGTEFPIDMLLLLASLSFSCLRPCCQLIDFESWLDIGDDSFITDEFMLNGWLGGSRPVLKTQTMSPVTLYLFDSWLHEGEQPDHPFYHMLRNSGSNSQKRWEKNLGV